jgi:hypothetical protein
VAVAEDRSVTQALRGARARRVYFVALAKLYRTRNPHNANARRKRARGYLYPPGMRARSAAHAPPRLLGIASAACFGVPLGLACVPQLLAPPRCWCTYSGHLPLGAPTRRVKRGTTTPIFSSGGSFRRYRTEKPNGVIGDLNCQRGYRSNTYAKYAGPFMGLMVPVPLVGGRYAAL